MTEAKGPAGKRKGPGKSKTSPAAIETAQRHAKWLELKVAGKSFATIAELHGVAESTVHEAVTRRLRETIKTPADELRTLELARLDAQLERLLKAIESSNGLNAAAESLFLKESERRAKLLGLDAPAKTLDVTPPREETVERVRGLLLNPTEEFAALLAETGWVRQRVPPTCPECGNFGFCGVSCSRRGTAEDIAARGSRRG